MVSPLICVTKKDKTVRYVIDFRYVNKFTLSDALGPPNIGDVSQRIARAKYITIQHLTANQATGQFLLKRNISS